MVIHISLLTVIHLVRELLADFRFKLILLNEHIILNIMNKAKLALVWNLCKTEINLFHITVSCHISLRSVT